MMPVDKSELTPWKPEPTSLPTAWMGLIEYLQHQEKARRDIFILHVKYDAQFVANMLRSWGLPWQVVIAGYLWGYDKEQIRKMNLPDNDQVIQHMIEAHRY